jgi:prevent-host-death family protein
MCSTEKQMNLSQDIHPLTDFKRNTSEFLRQLKESGNPVVLTINGRAELVVQDAGSYQRLFDLAERLETIQAVKEGLASAERGEGKQMDDVFDALEKDLRRPKPRR